MRIPRFYHPDTLQTDGEIRLNRATSSHLLNVLRLKVGASLQLFDGRGKECSARLIAVQQNQAVIKITDNLINCCESPLFIHLAQGISRGEKMDYTLQKAVELGVQKITPLFTEHSGVKLTTERLANRMAHWQAVIVSACEQCGRNYLPTLEKPLALTDWVAQCSANLKLILDPTGQQKLNNFNLDNTSASVSLVVGAEGGFSAAEVRLAEKFNFQVWRLGPRILRTETAAPAAITALQCRWGDM